MSLLTRTKSITLSSTLCLVFLLLVITPWHLLVPFTTIICCLSTIAARRDPFGVISCGSSGMYFLPSLQFASISIITDLPAKLAFSISTSSATKKGKRFSSSQFSCGPYPLIILICFSLLSISTTSSSKLSEYSSTSFGFIHSWIPIIVPPPFAFRIASKITKFSILNFPFVLQCVSCTVTILHFVCSTSAIKLFTFPPIIPAPFVENILMFGIERVFLLPCPLRFLFVTLFALLIFLWGWS